ncbi:MAG: hypothetical protein II225_03420, partial [Ruminococcus sp.]|nr:hypothetical protein [Ruminococcus sp.]
LPVQYDSKVLNAEELQAVLNNYNNVIYLSGHSHWELNSIGNMYGGTENIPVAINTSSVNYPWTDYDGYPGEGHSIGHNASEGFYVRVYEDKTIFMGRDFLNNKWIPDACYVIYNKDVDASEKVEMIVEDTLASGEYITNSYGRKLTFTSSDTEVVTVDAQGNLFAAGPGEAVVTVIAAATDTEVITIKKVNVIVGGEGYPSKFILHSESEDHDAEEALIYTADKNVVKVTLELTPGVHNIAVTKGNNMFGANVSVNDVTEESIVLGSDTDRIALNATGGYYTFTYTISENKLDIEFEPLDFTETGSKTATIYVDYKDSDFTSTPYIYIWDENKESVNKNIGPFAPGQLLSGPNSEGYYYRTFKYDTSYQFVISDGENVKTADSIVHDQEEVYVYFTEGTDYVTEKAPWFWIDLTPNDPSDPIDRLYPELVGMDGTYPLYCFYLPAGVDARKLRLYGDEGANMKVSFVPVTVDGTKTVNVSGGVNKATKYNITDANNKTFAKLTVKQSGEIP